MMMMISLLKYSKENRYPQVKSRKKNSKKPIYNSIVIKKGYLEAQQSYGNPGSSEGLWDRLRRGMDISPVSRASCPA